MIMSLVIRNLSFTAAVKLRFHAFAIPWVNRQSCISCPQGRGYCGSFNVKYVPNKICEIEEFSSESLKLKEGDKRSNEPRIRKLGEGLRDIDPKNHDISNEDSGKFAADCTKICERVPASQSQDAARMAIELVASRAVTAQELKKKLQRKSFQNEIVDGVINDFQCRGLINDCLYAEAYARSKWSSSSWGPRRIKQELFKKGVSKPDAENAIKMVFHNEDTSSCQDSGVDMSQLSIDQLYDQASKQWLRSRGVSHETRKARIVRWLQYRGFNWNVINFVLKKLESDCPP